MLESLKKKIDTLRGRSGKAARNEAQQAELERSARQLTLYCRPTCPFCIKVFLALRRLDVPVERRNITTDAQARKELVSEGGRQMVPCLRIAESAKARWLYESDDIIEYLDRRFGVAH